MTFIKLEISPSFDPCCCVQLDIQSSSYDLSVQINGADQDVWNIKGTNSPEIILIESIARKVIENVSTDKRIILDGVELKCTVVDNEITRQHEFKCPESGSDELILVNRFLKLIEKSISEQSLINYIERIEGYFADYLPAKIFEEKPLRLRIYGLLSVHEREGLAAIIDNLQREEELTVDMTNFISMGTVLYDCFQPLKKIRKLTFLANNNALRHIKAMGLDKSIVLLIR